MSTSKPGSAMSAREATVRAATAAKIIAALSRPSSSKPAAWTEPEKVEGDDVVAKEKKKKKPKDEEKNVEKVSDEVLIEEDEEFDEEEEKKKDPKSCWDRVSETVTSIWRTTDMMSGEETVTIVRTTTRELAIYLVFMGVLVFVTLSNMSPRQYEFTDIIKNGLFMNTSQVGMVFDFWQFMNTDYAQSPDLTTPTRDFMIALYWESMYNDGNMSNVYPCPYGQPANPADPCPVPEHDRLIMYGSKLLGVPRMRQLRVRNDSCNVPENFKKLIKVCYDKYSPAIEDKEDFGPANLNYTSPDAWRYQTEKELGSSSVWGYLTTYSGAGSVQDLGQTADETKKIFRELVEGLWIGRGTRFVSVDFTIYNANVNLFCVVKLIFEFPPTGGVVAGYDQFNTVKLLKYVTAYDYAVLGGEFIFAVFVIYYLIEELLELKKMKIEYFYSFWNLLDMVVITISLSTIGFSIYRYIIVSVMLKSLLAEPNLYPDFSNLAFWNQTFQNGAGITIFVSWIKIFKYISFNKTMSQLSGTLTQCAGDVGAFSIMFFIVFFAYAQFAYLILGASIEQYSTMTNTVFSQFRQILGDFDFQSIQDADRVLGPLWFVTFVFFIFFILMNMFLAIINDTYSEVKAEVNARKEAFQMGDFIMRGFNNLRGSVAERDKLVDIKTTIKLANEDGVITFEEIRESLRKLNFSDTEIEVFCARYDVDGNFEFSFEEVRAAIDEGLEELKVKPEEEAEGPLAFNLLMFEGLQTRVERMGNLMSQVVKKVNTVLEKLDAIEEPRRVSGGARSISSAGARSMKSAGARSMKSAGARSISSAKGDDARTPQDEIQEKADEELIKFDE